MWVTVHRAWHIQSTFQQLEINGQRLRRTELTMEELDCVITGVVTENCAVEIKHARRKIAEESRLSRDYHSTSVMIGGKVFGESRGSI